MACILIMYLSKEDLINMGSPSNPVYVKIVYGIKENSRRQLCIRDSSIEEDVFGVLVKKDYQDPMSAFPVRNLNGSTSREVKARLPEGSVETNGLAKALQSIRGIKLKSIETYIPLKKEEFS